MTDAELIPELRKQAEVAPASVYVRDLITRAADALSRAAGEIEKFRSFPRGEENARLEARILSAEAEAAALRADAERYRWLREQDNRWLIGCIDLDRAIDHSIRAARPDTAKEGKSNG